MSDASYASTSHNADWLVASVDMRQLKTQYSRKDTCFAEIWDSTASRVRRRSRSN